MFFPVGIRDGLKVGGQGCGCGFVLYQSGPRFQGLAVRAVWLELCVCRLPVFAFTLLRISFM